MSSIYIHLEFIKTEFLYFEFQPGSFVKVHVKNVPSHLAASLSSNYPLSLVGILPHEQRMSVVNFVLKRNNNCPDQTPIPSKERLVFHCGYRRYAASPIFSQHTAANKHKVYFRLFTFSCHY